MKYLEFFFGFLFLFLEVDLVLDFLALIPNSFNALKYCLYISSESATVLSSTLSSDEADATEDSDKDSTYFLEPDIFPLTAVSNGSTELSLLFANDFLVFL